MNSIGDFAESLILQDITDISEGKKSSFSGGGLAPSPDCPDISEIELTDSQRRALLLGENIVKDVQENRNPEEICEEPTINQPVNEDPITQLLGQLSYLVEKAESLVNRLDEMTTVGACGTNQKFNLMKSEPITPPPSPRVMNKVKNLRKNRRIR